MCYLLYLFTEKVIEQTSFEKDNPNMFVRKEDISRFNSWSFSDKNAYYIGSSQGCGCGWSPGYNNEPEQERSQRIKDRENLFKLIKENDLGGSHLVICWAGCEVESIEGKENLNIEDIKNIYFEFEELISYTLIAK